MKLFVWYDEGDYEYERDVLFVMAETEEEARKTINAGVYSRGWPADIGMGVCPAAPWMGVNLGPPQDVFEAGEGVGIAVHCRYPTD